MMRRLLPLLLLLLISASVEAQDSTDMNEIVKEVGLDQKLGSQVPLDLTFRDESGNMVRLGDYFGQKPVILTLVYYECPMLCTLILNGTLRAMRALEFSAGKEFEVVTVSINPRETPELASRKKTQYLESYDREGSGAGWHFLTGQEDQIKPLADAVGFRYRYDEDSGQYAHASGIMVLTPNGQVARYFYGVEYSPRDLRLGLVEASSSKIGSPVDQVLLLCYHYDPTSGKYTVAVMTFLRIAGGLTLLGIGLLILILLRRERTTSGTAAPAGV